MLGLLGLEEEGALLDDLVVLEVLYLVELFGHDHLRDCPVELGLLDLLHLWRLLLEWLGLGRFGFVLVYSLLLDDFLDVLYPGEVDSILYVGVPLLKLVDVAGAHMEALELGVFDLHEHLHDPAEVLLILGFSNAEGPQGVLLEIFGED